MELSNYSHTVGMTSLQWCSTSPWIHKTMRITLSLSSPFFLLCALTEMHLKYRRVSMFTMHGLWWTATHTPNHTFLFSTSEAQVNSTMPHVGPQSVLGHISCCHQTNNLIVWFPPNHKRCLCCANRRSSSVSLGTYMCKGVHEGWWLRGGKERGSPPHARTLVNGSVSLVTSCV